MCKKLIYLISFVLVLSFGSVANAALEDGLLVFHDFGGLFDGSGNGHDAELFGNAEISGGYLELDGTQGTYALVGEDTFGPVNPAIDALSDFTIAVVYNTTDQSNNMMLVSLGPATEAEGTGDLCFFANGSGTEGHGVDHWYYSWFASEDSGINYADGDDHLVVVTYTTEDDMYIWYHLVGGVAADHGTDGEADWSEAWDIALDYVIGLGTSSNPGVDNDHGPAGEGTWNYFNGNIDKFAIWDRALDTDEMPGILDMEGGAGPSGASNPRPDNREERVDPDNLLLIWDKDPNALASKEVVYFSSNEVDVNTRSEDANQGIQDANEYPAGGSYLSDVCDLILGETYYWAIDETLDYDPCDAPGPLWHFTLKDANAAVPSPEVNEIVRPCPTLTWDAGYHAAEHRVYFDVNEVNVINRVGPCTLLVEPVAESWTPTPPLEWDTTYYWAVDENDVCDVNHAGPLWYFRVPSDPCDGADWRGDDDTFYTIWGFNGWGTGPNDAADYNTYPYDPNFEPNCTDGPNDYEASYIPDGGTIRYHIAENNDPPAEDDNYGFDTMRFKHTDNSTPGQNVEVRVGIVWSGDSRPSVQVERLSNWLNGPAHGLTGSGAGAWMESFEAGGNNKNDAAADLEFEIQLCDGWMYSVYEVFFETVTEEADNIHVFIESGGEMRLDRVDVDAHWYTSPFAAGPSPYDEEEDVELDKDLTWYSGLYATKHEVYFGENDNVQLGAPDSHGASNPVDAVTLSENTFNLSWVDSGVWLTDHNNATGVWHLIGEAEMEFSLADYDIADPNKIIDLTITWQSGNTKPEGEAWAWDEDSAEWSDANIVSETGPDGDGWIESHYRLILEPNPEGEIITLTCEAPNDIFIAEVNIITDCNGRGTRSGWDFLTDGFGTGPPYVATKTVDNNSYDPALEPGKTYYWMIDEVNDACSPYRWRSDIWSFTTVNFVVVEDFEVYTSHAHLYGVWEDYWAPSTLGSFVYVSTAGSHVTPGGLRVGTPGVKGMQMGYWSFYGDTLTRRTYASVQNWSDPLAALAIWFLGRANDLGYVGGAAEITADDIFVTLSDDDNADGTIDDSWTVKYVADSGGDVCDLLEQQWMEWNIALSDFNEFNGVDLDKIKRITLGAVPKAGTNERGDIYFDDIRVYVRRCVPDFAYDIASDPENIFYAGGPDCIVDEWDIDIMFEDWLLKDSNEISVFVADADPNLLAWYKLDVDTQDSSGRGKHATIAIDAAGTVDQWPIWAADHNEDSDGNSIDLTGFNYIDIPDLADSPGDANYAQASICLWVRVDAFAALSLELHGLFCDDDYTDGDIHIQFIGPEETIDGIEFSGAGFGEVSADLVGIEFGEWVHMAWTYDSNGAKTDPNAIGKHKAYINGEQIADQNSAADSNLVELGPAAVGAWNSEGTMGRFINARFDDIRIYNRVLSQGEITYLTGVPAGTNRWWPPNSDAEFVTDEAWGQKYINFRDYAFIMNYWLVDQLFPFVE